MYVNGKRVTGQNSIGVASPYSGQIIGEVSSATANDIEQVVALAGRGADLMRRMTAGERAEILDRTSARLREDGEMARLISGEVGKTIREARAEVARSAQTLKLSADAARNLTGETVRFDLAGRTGKTGFYTRVPLGIVLTITPFNFPLNLACHKIGPALAGGNAVIHKPASQTPLSGIRLAEMLVACGLPPEAISVVTGPGSAVGDQLVAHAAIRKVSFTGSVETGARISAKAGIKKLTMELGSNSAVLVLADASLADAVRKIRTGGYAVAGQVCISVQRVYVHESVFGDFLDALVDQVRSIRIGDPLEEETELGPMISEKEAQRAETWIGEAIRAGGGMRLGGGRRGALVDPVVLADVPESCRVVADEAFAPLVVVNRYGTLDEGISKVNNSRYGLQAGVFTRDIQSALTAVEALEVGGVLVNEVPTFRVDNMPYGGTKLSGVGREGPRFAIEEMTEPKLVVFNSLL